VEALSAPRREALLLRYFKNNDFRAVGESLGISDDAAQKRVSRAVERLREFFSKRKVTVGTSGLSALVSANAIQAAPAGLAGTVAAGALAASTAISASAAVAITQTIAMTTIQKTIIAAVAVGAIVTGVYQARQASKLREQVQTLKQQQQLLPAIAPGDLVIKVKMV